MPPVKRLIAARSAAARIAQAGGSARREWTATWRYRGTAVYDVPAELVLGRGVVGLLPLVPITRGGMGRRIIERAAREIEAWAPMRIERLALDNARSQGAARRRWYQQQSPEHLRRIAGLVDQALAGRSVEAPGTAIILGAGACTEIPLERLARACERVVLVDLDAPGMERARVELPMKLRSRVRSVVADLTGGVSGALGALLNAQPWADLAGLSPDAVIGAAADCVERCAVPIPPDLAALGAGTFRLVVSSMTLTQLFSLPLLDVLDVLGAVAPDLVGRQEADARYQRAARDFRRRVALAHLDLLAVLLAPGGAGILATDVTGYLIPARRGPHARERRESLAILPKATLDLGAELRTRFTVDASPVRWRWLATAPTSTNPGREFDVVGCVLRARSPHGDT